MSAGDLSRQEARPDFAGVVALVSGAARGLGYAVASSLAAAGAEVMLADIDGERVVRSAERLGRHAHGYALDVTDWPSVEAVARRIEAEHGRVTLLVNNAGICGTEDFPDLDVEQWNRTLATNVTGAFHCMRAFLPAMRGAGGGVIVNVGSLAGRSGGIMVSAAYSASKAGIAGLTKAAARQLAKYAIRVNCVAPGTLETDMTAGWDPNALAAVRDSVPLGRLGTVDDVVQTVLFLASPAARYITGVTLDVNGGIYIAP